MDNPEILDSLFQEAVSAIDAGDVTALERLLAVHPRLVHEHLDSPGAWLSDKVGSTLEGFFRQPYLLWFVAEDSVRNAKLPGNIAQVTRTIIQAAEREGVDSLLERGASLTLSTALCLGRWKNVQRLARSAALAEKQDAFVLAALNGKAEALCRMLALGVDPTTVSAQNYSHATALHHAVWSRSLDAVRVLVEAGADLSRRDTIYNGTPLGWANYGEQEQKEESRARQYAEIAEYLREKGGAE